MYIAGVHTFKYNTLFGSQTYNLLLIIGADHRPRHSAAIE